jgi:serine-type D-Ala-D-Ala carboxypeptidase/endopeptidase (penicillin-binding protein 4)
MFRFAFARAAFAALSAFSAFAGSASLATLTTLLAAAPALAQDPLPQAVLDALAKAGAPPESFAGVAVPLGHRTAPWRFQHMKPMQPGSAMKLVTAIVALDTLGATHTGRTRLITAAPVVEGTLQGDLILQGGADPTFTIGEFWRLLLELRDRGVRRVEGDLVLDRSRYRPARLDVGAPPFDERPEGWWNVIPDALLIDGGLQPVELSADGAGLSARLMPALAGASLDPSRVRLVDAPCAQWDAGWEAATLRDGVGNGVGNGAASSGREAMAQFNGTFPRNCRRVEEMQLIDRSRYIELLFAQTWRELGGQWTGRVREGTAPASGTRLIAEHRSAPWGEVLRPLMKTSDNTLTRLLFLELGVPGMAAAPGRDTIDIAREFVPQWFAQKGIAADGLVVDNGSGLSRSERISPQTLAELVRWAYGSRHAPDLLMSLPVAGVDGTLRNRIKASPATGMARLKTGTLRNVAALAGVAYDADARPWAVAVIVNHDIGAGARPALDAFVDAFAREGPVRWAARAGSRGGAAAIGPQADGP